MYFSVLTRPVFFFYENKFSFCFIASFSPIIVVFFLSFQELSISFIDSLFIYRSFQQIKECCKLLCVQLKLALNLKMSEFEWVTNRKTNRKRLNSNVK